MVESRGGSATSRGRAAVVAVVAVVALVGVSAAAVGGSSAAGAGGSADWSSDPSKEVTADNETVCPPEDDTTDDDTSEEETDGSGYQLEIDYDGEWTGTIVTEDTETPIEGTGDETIDIEADEGARIAASVSKATISDETMDIRLLFNGEVIDERLSAEPDVDNFDRTDDSTVGDTSSDSSFNSSSNSDSLGDTTTDDWNTFGEDDEGSVFDDTPDDDANTLDSDTDDTSDTGDTYDTNRDNDTSTDEECNPAEEDDTTTTTNTTITENTPEDDSDISIATDEDAQIVFANQTADGGGTEITVKSATLPDGGIIVIYDTSMMDGDGSIEESVVGVSEELDAQRSQDIEVTLANKLEENQTLVAVAYRDTDDNGDFNFDDAGEAIDEAYTDDEDEAVGDDAYVRVPGDDDAAAASSAEDGSSGTDMLGDDSTATDTDDEAVFVEETATTDDDAGSESVFTDTATTTDESTRTETGTETRRTTQETPSTDMSGNAVEESTETNAPGFGMGVAIVALLGAALVATRRS
jgi:PGF-CTERM protein